MKIKYLLVGLFVFATVAGVCLAKAEDIHITGGRRNNSWPWRVNDSAGYMWDIYNNGMVNDGTSDAYDGGMRLQISGANFQSGTARVNGDNTEIEIGPWSRGAIRVWRRIYVNKKAGYCRWVDIFENTSGTEQNLKIRYYSNMGSSVQSVNGASGDEKPNGQDWAAITSSHGGNRPNVVHVLASPKAKFTPRFQYNIGNDNVYYHANLQIKGGKTRALCIYHAQRRSKDLARKFLENFDHSEEIRKMPQELREIIANFSIGSFLGGIHLERSDAADKVVEDNGDVKFGKVLNKKFSIRTFFETIDVPAEQVIGMAAPPGPGDGLIRVALTNGQILCGNMDEQKLELKMSVGTLELPLERIRQWSYKISKHRPEDIEFSGPLAILRTGDCLAFDPAEVELDFITRYGPVALNGKHILAIHMDNPGHVLHRVEFLNGSQLGGVLEAETVTLKLDLGPQLKISRNMVSKLQFAPEASSRPQTTCVKLTNGDELYGRLTDEKIGILTDYGSKVELKPRNIKTLSFSKTHLGRTVALLWDKSILRGELVQKDLKFKIEPGPELAISPNQCLSITRPQALPPKEVMEKLDKLVARLGAESYKDRQAATEELVSMGKEIVPLLQKYLNTNDPEVRQRLQHVIERLGGKAESSTRDSTEVFSPIK